MRVTRAFAATISTVLLLASAPVDAQEVAQEAREEAFPYGQGHFLMLRELHLATYEPDARWRRTWARSKFAHSGIDFVHGSVSQTDLFTERRVVLNVPVWPQVPAGDAAEAAPKVWLRYVRDEIKAVTDESDLSRIELQWNVWGPVSLTASGHPEFAKERSSGGAGVFVADAKRRNYLDLKVQADEPFFNQRTHYDARHVASPMRMLGEANLERGPWRLHAAADLGNRARTVFEDALGSGGVRERTVETRRLETTVEWANESWLLGVRQRSSSRLDRREHFAGYAHPERILDDYDFRRRQDALDAYADWEEGRFRMRGMVGVRRQRDLARMGIAPDYALARDEWLAGAVGYWRPVEGFHLGLGYWGNLFQARRDVDELAFARRDTPRADHSVDGSLDKAMLVLGYAVSERIRAETVLTQQMRKGRFGGGSLKATVMF